MFSLHVCLCESVRYPGTGQLWATLWLLGTDTGFSARTARTQLLSHLFSPKVILFFFKQWHSIYLVIIFSNLKMWSMNCHTKFFKKYFGCLLPKGLKTPGSILPSAAEAAVHQLAKHPSCILSTGVKCRASSSLFIPQVPPFSWSNDWETQRGGKTVTALIYLSSFLSWMSLKTCSS